MSQNYIRKEFYNTTNIADGGSEVVELDGCDVGTLQVIAGAVLAAQVFASTAVNITTNQVTITAHGYLTGTVGQLTTTGALPTGLSLATNYYIIVIDANTVSFVTTLANALAGTTIDLTAQGSGNDTFTSVAKAGTVQPQVTNVANPVTADWVNKGTATTLTGGAQNAVVEYDRKELAYAKFRLLIASAAGSFDFRVVGNFKS